MNRHNGAKDAKDDVHLPLDIDERRRDEVAGREVKGPVRRRAQRDRLAVAETAQAGLQVGP